MSFRFKTIVSCLLLLIVATGIFAVTVFDPTSIASQRSSVSSKVASSTAPNTARIGVASFGNLLSASESLECRIRHEDKSSNKTIDGNLLSHKSNVRGDFVQTDTELGTIVTTYIITDASLYVWSEIDGVNYGARYDVAQIDSANLPISRNQNVRYDCIEWEKNETSVFEPPADILFKDAAEADVEYGTLYPEGEF